MARKLRTYQTSLGFFDLAIAAPSMKAALEAWGSKTNLFQQGFAKETNDPAIVAATLAKPGVVLRRPRRIGWRVQRTCRAAEGTPHRQGEGEDSKASSDDKRTAGSEGRRRQHARLPLRLTENGSGAIASAARKRPRGRGNASGASRQSQRPKQRLKKRSVSMKPRSKKSKETAPHSTDGRKRRTRAGQSRRRNWKPLCAGRAASHVAMSQDAQGVEPSVVPGARPAPFPGFVEPCHPTLREETPSGARWIHEIKFDGYRTQGHLRGGRP